MLVVKLEPEAVRLKAEIVQKTEELSAAVRNFESKASEWGKTEKDLASAVDDNTQQRVRAEQELEKERGDHVHTVEALESGVVVLTATLEGRTDSPVIKERWQTKYIMLAQNAPNRWRLTSLILECMPLGRIPLKPSKPNLSNAT